MAAIFAAVLAGVLIPFASDWALQTQVILALAFAGLAVLAVIPNRRIALACAWVLALPLSLEKVFSVFPPAYRGFMGTTMVLSGADLVFYVLVLSLIFEANITRRKIFFWPAAATPYALLVAWVVAMFFLMGPTGTGAMQVFHWVKMLAYLVVFSSAIRNRQEVMTVLLAAAAAVLIQSVIVGIAYTTDHKIGFSSKVTSEAMMMFTGGTDSGESFTRATGTVGHVNQQAMFHTFFTLPLIGLFMVRNWIWRVLITITVMGSFCAITLTFSRTSWIACGLSTAIILFVAWRCGRITRRGWLTVCMGALAVALCLGAFSPMIVERLTKGDDGASSSRIRMALLALDHITSHPITGVGPGNFINAKLAEYPVQWARNVWLPREQTYKPRDLAGLELYEVELQGHHYFMPGVVHNKFLLVTAELGFVGLALFLWFQWRILRAAVSILRAMDPVLWWLGVALVADFFANQTEFMLELFYDDKTVLMPLFIDALILAAARIAAESTRPEAAA